MFKFCSLFSGSAGNSLFVETENSKILVDAGESAKKIVSALSLIGVDINDIDFPNGRLKVRRKGGYEDVVYFGEEVEKALKDYLNERNQIIPMEGHENAFFLSMQNRRITVRSVEKLVKKYASNVTSVKKITPHKLRSTFGTNLYQETGDIYLVADVLGHKDVNTTRKHYAAMKDEHKRKAAKAVKLREE